MDPFSVSTPGDSTESAFASATQSASYGSNNNNNKSGAENPFLLDAKKDNKTNNNQGRGSTSSSSTMSSVVKQSPVIPVDYIAPTDPEKLRQELYSLREQNQRLQTSLAQKDLDFEQKENMYKETIRKLEYPTKKNWPWCFPILHHDINDDIITDQRRKLVRLQFVIWHLSAILLLYNLICIMIAWFSGVLRIKNEWLSFTSALLAVLIGVPLSWWMWYGMLYNRCKEEKVTSAWWVLFFNFFMNLVYCFYSISGWYYGTAGFYQMVVIDKYSSSDKCKLDHKCGKATFAVYMFLSNGLLWIAYALLSIFQFIRLYRYYRMNCSANPADVPMIKPMLLAAL